MFAHPTMPWGRGWDRVNFKKQFFLGFNEISRSAQISNFCHPTPHEGVEGVNFKQNILLGIQYNVKICTEMSCLPSLTAHGVERSFDKKLLYII